MINGNITGIKKSILERLENLEDQKLDASVFLPLSLMEELCAITGEIGREVCLYIRRSGEVLYVSVGEGDRVGLEAMTFRRNTERLTGLRCIHTHPNSASAVLSSVDIESLKKLRFDAMAAVSELQGKPTGMAVGILALSPERELTVSLHSTQDIAHIPQDLWMQYIEDADKEVHANFSFDTDNKVPERLLLMGNDSESLQELARLADTAGGLVIDTVIQKRTGNSFGKGKLQELSLLIQSKNIDLAVYDEELSGVQQKNMEEALGIRVIDRTALILDIFAMRAVTSEGKMQVELAQQKYLYSRLTGLGTELSRLAGGIGTRGPGENKLETDRRHIRRRTQELQRQLETLTGQRELQRKRREKNAMPTLALVGYTNAGKSTLLSALSGSEVFAEDKLFATLDPLTRRCELDTNIEVCITDTVGFIKKLPHQLVEAFRSTLEVAAYADLLIHVCDGSSPQLAMQMQAVQEVLVQIGAGSIPQITVINKIDAVPADARPLIKDAVYISAKTGEGIEDLKIRILKEMSNLRAVTELLIPYSRGDILAFIHACGKVIETTHEEQGTRIKFTAAKDDIERIKSKLGV